MKLALSDEAKFLELFDVPEDVQAELFLNIRRRMTAPISKIHAQIDVTCFGYDGINAIKKALQAGENLAKELKQPLEIRLITPPVFVMNTQNASEEEGLDFMKKVMSVIEKTIKSYAGGNLNVRAEPQASGDREHQVATLVAALNADKREEEIEKADRRQEMAEEVQAQEKAHQAATGGKRVTFKDPSENTI